MKIITAKIVIAVPTSADEARALKQIDELLNTENVGIDTVDGLWVASVNHIETTEISQLALPDGTEGQRRSDAFIQGWVDAAEEEVHGALYKAS